MKAALTVVFLTLVLPVWGQNPIRYEAEDISGPVSAWRENQHGEVHWNLWSKDVDAETKWSGGVVLQSPRVMVDRAHPEDGAPPVKSTVSDLLPGKYHLRIARVGRPLAVSLNGKTWRRIDPANSYLGVVEISAAPFHLWVDDRFADPENPGSCYYDYLEFTPLPDPDRKPKVEGFAKQRVAELLDRGLVARPTDGGAVYLGWRLLERDDPGTAFHVLRSTGGAAVRITDRPVAATTDFVDRSPVKGGPNVYQVVPVVSGKMGGASKPCSATPGRAGDFVSIPLRDKDTRFQKCGIADLNGDGAHDFVIKHPDSNVDPYKRYWKRSTDRYKIDAYLSDGTFLWRRDLGWSIERGIWYSPMIVRDLDGDGRAEVCLKAGEGDPRDPDGRVTGGAEFLLVLDGMTGEERARVAWPARELFSGYNYYSRNQLGVAYLDGRTPCLIALRGTYQAIHAHAFQFHDDKLLPLWQWSDAEEGGRFRGQGAHSMHAVDVDADGRDEVFIGSAVLDDNGVGLWSTGLGHPDHHYVGDIDPARPGLEVYYGIETRAHRNGCCLADARTGEILWGVGFPTRHVHSTGLCADIDPTSPGSECYSRDTDQDKNPAAGWLFDARGRTLRGDLDWRFGLRAVYWDADPQRELIRGSRIFNYEDNSRCGTVEGRVVAFADVFGDWREELVVSVPGELRIHSTRIPATDRRVTLMSDPLYRNDVCLQAMGYTQCPMTTRSIGR